MYIDIQQLVSFSVLWNLKKQKKHGVPLCVLRWDYQIWAILVANFESL